MESLGKLQPQHFCVGFVVRQSVPDALSVCDAILERYINKYDDFSLGEDTTYMEGEEPHYHLNFITCLHDKDTGKIITKRSLEKIRESSWHYGQKLSLKISPLRTDISNSELSFLAYACKENVIRHSIIDEHKHILFTELALKALLTKKTTHQLWEKEQNNKLAKKDLKDKVLDYMGAHWDRQVSECEAWTLVPGNNKLLSESEFTECEIARVILERFQLEEKRHFRPFEIDRFVCEYFRKKLNDPIKMFIFRNMRHRAF